MLLAAGGGVGHLGGLGACFMAQASAPVGRVHKHARAGTDAGPRCL